MSAARAVASCILVGIAVSTAGCSISPQSDATVVGPAPALDDASRTTEEAGRPRNQPPRSRTEIEPADGTHRP